MAHVKGLSEPDILELSNGVWSDAFMNFIKWSQGKAPLEPALASVAKYFKAEAVCLSRIKRTNSNARIVQIVDGSSDPAKPKLNQSFAKAALGDVADHLKQGATVMMSDTRAHGFPDKNVDYWMLRRGVVDIGFICLEAENGTRDILEFHFAGNSMAVWIARSAQISTKLADVYKGRHAGLIEKHILRDKSVACGGKHGRPTIMAPNNPACLTRSEWRLCMLVACGLSREGVAKELGVTDNTIRTHLRNIYGKTGYTTFHELALKLVGPDEQRNLPDAINIDAA